MNGEELLNGQGISLKGVIEGDIMVMAGSAYRKR